MGLQIFANIDATSLGGARVVSSTDLRSKSFKQFAAGDAVVVDIFLTGQNGALDIQAYPTRRLGIGSINAKPTGGTFDIGSQTGLAYNISASDLQTAITAEVAACTITQLAPFTFKCEFNANGDQTIPSIDATALTPSSTVSIQAIVEGTGSVKEQWLIRLFENPIAIVDSNWTNISGNGVRGTLNLGTVGVYDLLDSNTSVNTTIELEITDANGDIQTIFQAPLTLTGEVIGQGVTGVASFGSYATAAQLAAGFTRSTYVFVSDADGSDSEGQRGRADKPYKTTSAGFTASQAGDVVVIRDGDFSSSSNTPVNNTYIRVEPKAIGPTLFGFGNSFSCEGKFTKISDFASATLKGFNATFDYVSVGSGGDCFFDNCDFIGDSTTNASLSISGGGTTHLRNCRVTATVAGLDCLRTQSNTDIILANDTEFISEDGGNGIQILGTALPSVQLKDCAIKTVVTGTYTAPKAIKQTSATSTIYVLGSLSSTHDTDGVVLDGGIHTVNSNFDL